LSNAFLYHSASDTGDSDRNHEDAPGLCDSSSESEPEDMDNVDEDSSFLSNLSDIAAALSDVSRQQSPSHGGDSNGEDSNQHDDTNQDDGNNQATDGDPPVNPNVVNLTVNYGDLDQPLYTVDGWSSITRRESILSVIFTAQQNHMSLSGMMDAFKLVQFHLPEFVHYASDIKTLQKKCGFTDESFTKHTYCSSCRNPTALGMCQDDKCAGSKEEYFVMNDVVNSLELVINKKGMLKQIKEMKYDRGSCVISDVQDGNIYKNMCAEGGFLYSERYPENFNLTFTVSLDGVIVHKCPRCELHPVLALINEIPEPARYKMENMIVIAVWQSKSDVNWNTFIAELNKLFEKLADEGIDLILHGEVVRVKIAVINFTMDLKERYLFLSMTNHKGKFPCIFCYNQGDSIILNRTEGDETDDEDNLRTTTSFMFNQTEHMRTDEEVLEDARQAGKKKERGIKKSMSTDSTISRRFGISVICRWLVSVLTGCMVLRLDVPVECYLCWSKQTYSLLGTSETFSSSVLTHLT